MDELRLECLRLAHQPEMPAATVVERAKAYHDFLVGCAGPSPRNSDAATDATRVTQYD